MLTFPDEAKMHEIRLCNIYPLIQEYGLRLNTMSRHNAIKLSTE